MDNIIELNELIYGGTKLVGDKVGNPPKNPNRKKRGRIKGGINKQQKLRKEKKKGCNKKNENNSQQDWPHTTGRNSSTDNGKRSENQKIPG